MLTKQKMLLPLNCDKHTHEGYGTTKDVECPWCEIAKLRQIIADVMYREMNGLKPVLRTGDAEWADIQPSSGEPTREHHCPTCLCPDMEGAGFVEPRDMKFGLHCDVHGFVEGGRVQWRLGIDGVHKFCPKCASENRGAEP